VDLYIITGLPNTRKSASIRALTGIRISSEYDILFKSGVKKVWVQMTAPNEIETKEYPNGMTPKQLISLLKKKKIDAAIIPLRTANMIQNLPDANEYINQLRLASFRICSVVMFNEHSNIPSGTNNHLIPDTRVNPSNQTASILRKLWGII